VNRLGGACATGARRRAPVRAAPLLLRLLGVPHGSAAPDASVGRNAPDAPVDQSTTDAAVRDACGSAWQTEATAAAARLRERRAVVRRAVVRGSSR
jgi:hypothetical protein